MLQTRQRFTKGAILFFVLLCSGVGNGYSVLTHEEMVDLLWKDQLRPLLLERFPQASEEDLKQMDTEVKRVVVEAAEFATESPEPALSELYTDVYA